MAHIHILQISSRWTRKRKRLSSISILIISCMFLEDIWLSGCAGADPSFSQQPSDMQVLPGDSGEMKCIIQDMDPNSHCFWKKGADSVEIADRYSFTGASTLGDCSMRISSSNLAMDDGLWSCGSTTTTSKQGIASQPAKYTILQKPKDTIILKDNLQAVNGSDMIIDDFQYPPEIQCKSENANPAAELKWVNANTGAPLNGNYSVINETMNANKTKTAILTLQEHLDDSWQGMALVCVASHPYLDGVNYIAYVFIRKPQKPEYVEIRSDQGTSNSNIQVSTHDYVTLICHATGYPAPTYRWQNRLAETDGWNEYQPNNKAPNITFQAFDSQFMCEATNDDGLTYYPSASVITIETTSTSGAQIGTIIAIVVVCIVLVVLAAGGVYACYKKNIWPFKVPKQDKKNKDPEDGSGKRTNVDDPKDDENIEEVRELMDEVRPNNPVNDAPQAKVKSRNRELVYADLDLNQNGRKPSPKSSPAMTTVYAQIKPPSS